MFLLEPGLFLERPIVSGSMLNFRGGTCLITFLMVFVPENMGL